MFYAPYTIDSPMYALPCAPTAYATKPMFEALTFLNHTDSDKQKILNAMDYHLCCPAVYSKRLDNGNIFSKFIINDQDEYVWLELSPSEFIQLSEYCRVGSV